MRNASEATKNVGLNSVGLLMVDGPHFDDILQLGKRPLDFTEFFINGYRFQSRQIGLLSLNQVFAFQGLFLLEVDGMFRVAGPSLFQLPIVVASFVVVSQNAGGRGPNFFRGFQFPGRHSLFEGLEFFPRSRTASALIFAWDPPRLSARD